MEKVIFSLQKFFKKKKKKRWYLDGKSDDSPKKKSFFNGWYFFFSNDLSDREQVLEDLKHITNKMHIGKVGRNLSKKSYITEKKKLLKNPEHHVEAKLKNAFSWYFWTKFFLKILIIFFLSFFSAKIDQ